MALVIRQKCSRRLHLPVKFPLVDSREVTVLQERRRLANRRKAEYELDDMKVIFAKMAEN